MSRLGFAANEEVKLGLLKLLQDDPISAYWVGFITADGHISDRRLKVVLSSKDADHLHRFAQWLGPSFHASLERDNTTIALRRQNPEAIAIIRDRFDFRDKKNFQPSS